MLLVQVPHFENHWSRGSRNAFSTMRLFTQYKNLSSWDIIIILMPRVEHSWGKSSVEWRALWVGCHPLWLPAPFKVCGPLPRESTGGALSFLGWVWICVHCSLGFGPEAVHLLGVLRVSLDNLHMETRIVGGSYQNVTKMHFAFIEALSTEGLVLRWRWHLNVPK